MEVYQRVGVVANYCRQNETSLDPVNIAVDLLAIVFLEEDPTMMMMIVLLSLYPSLSPSLRFGFG